MSFDFEDSTEHGEESALERITVGIAEYAATDSRAALTTTGLGSCVAVCLYDDRVEAGGLVHVMLPVAEEMNGGPSAKFADTGTELLISEMESLGATTATLEAKIVGGSEMLDLLEWGSDIGAQNAQQARETLEDHDIPIVAEDVGGDFSRSIQLETKTGTLHVHSATHGGRTM